MASGWIQDDDLPTWAHTALLMIVVSPFALLLIWPGSRAVATGVLLPMMGPEFGQWMFGHQELRGHHAVLAGWVLISLGVTFFALGASFSRWAQERLLMRTLPWVLLIFDLVFYSYVLQVVKP
ncbi:hypothetical protein [Methylibium sp.]|nr:hypothetical protein [Methylibium sp.]